uniref:SCP domain-containing protein n=1 Tax=Oryza brachyantha TaxID=4533 RepID=J3MIB0_ORYBR
MMEAPKMGAAGAIAMLVAAVLAAATSSMAQNSPQDFVELHNVARSVEGLGDVVWDEAVAAYAESYAAERAGDCALIHSGSWEKAGYGENLFGGPGGECLLGAGGELVRPLHAGGVARLYGDWLRPRRLRQRRRRLHHLQLQPRGQRPGRAPLRACLNTLCLINSN